ncbi:MAG: phosphate butyryltransferase [Lachnospiraceae bacterium]|nr:phosphate butyryltransferase [Lachnospiraceae bacterium]
MINSMQDLLKEAAKGTPGRLAVACAQDEYVLGAVVKASELGIITPILVGNKTEIVKILEDLHCDGNAFEIVDVEDKTEACMKAAALVRDGKADFLMKGFVDTAVIMRAVLNRENGLRTGRRITHDLVLEVPGYDKLFHVTDSAMSVAPTLEEKADIIRNAVTVAHALGNENPKVAVCCAVEKVNPKMQCTVDAAELAEMNKRGEITGCIVEGPFALDNAISPEAAAHKGVKGEVAGKADIIMVPDIEAGNLLIKSMEYFAHAKKAGVILGAKTPIALTSRASTAESKLYTIAVARLAARMQQ